MRELKGMESMSPSRLLTELRGPLLVMSPLGCCIGGCGGQSAMRGVAEGPGYASWAMVVHDLSLPGACGPNFARIASDNWALLLHCLFDETRVES